MYTHTHIHACTTLTHPLPHIRARAYTHTHTHTHTHTNTHTHTHTHKHTNTRICTRTDVLAPTPEMNNCLFEDNSCRTMRDARCICSFPVRSLHGNLGQCADGEKTTCFTFPFFHIDSKMRQEDVHFIFTYSAFHVRRQ